jgi:SAM-dependent methyltransferase
METGAREQRLVFGEAAELYDRARPGYAAELVDGVLRFAGVEGDGLRALEVGAGTGKATVAFASRGLRILALEPSPQMAEVARRNCAAFPRVSVDCVTFEDWPPEPPAFGLLFSAQAWHWVDPAVRRVKAAQVLAPGGTLALIWHRIRWRGEPLRDDLEEIYRRLAPELYEQSPGFPGLTRRQEPAELLQEIRATGLFEQVQTRTHGWSQTFTADGFVERLATQSNHLLFDAARRSALFDGLRGLVAAHGGEIAIPHDTVVALAHRRLG